MSLLLDTHVFLWFVWNSARLSAAARALIQDPKNRRLISPASYWELAVKVSTGKLVLTVPFEVFVPHQVRKNRLRILPVKMTHAAVVAALPFHHRDPFDRMLAAQALAEQVPLVSADPIFDAYGVTRLW